MVEQPAKVMRIGNMIRQLLEEVRAAPLDEKSRARLKEIHQSSIKELEDGLAPELVDELERLSLPFTEDEMPSEAELRIAQAQLVGWLEGLFHGIQTTLFAQQMAARAQLEQMRRALPPGVMPPGPGATAPGPGLGTVPVKVIFPNGPWYAPRLRGPRRWLGAAEAQPPQPGGGLGELRVRGARPDLGGAAVAPGVAAEEAHFTADPPQPHQCLADPRVVDVPLAVDEEVVLAEPVAGRPRLDRGQVDAAHGELGEDLEQRARMVLDQERGQRRPVRPGARGQRAWAATPRRTG